MSRRMTLARSCPSDLTASKYRVRRVTEWHAAVIAAMPLREANAGMLEHPA
jgi:hypothetical protein